MKFLKGLLLGLLGFLLFISLNIFGLATQLYVTVLSPAFMSKEVASLDMASIASEVVDVQNADANFKAMQASAIETLRKLEPEIDKQLKTAIYSVYDYILGKKPDPELAKTLRATFLSKSFVDSAVAEIDIAPILNAIPEPPEGGGLQAALVATAVKMAPQLKQQAGNIADPLLAYLTYETQSIDLAQVLSSTLLSPEFISAALDEIDLATPLSQVLSTQLAQEVPSGASFLVNYVNANMPKTIAAIEPMLKEQLKTAAVPIANYLVGKSNGFSVNIELDEIMAGLKDNIKTAILASPPPEYAGLPQDAISAQFDAQWASFSASLGTSMTIDEQVLGPGTQAQITGTLAQLQTQLADVKARMAAGLGDAEEQMREIRPYIGYFQIGYWLLIAFMLVLIAGIILIYREVRGAARNLGTTFLIFGVVGVATYLIARFVGGSQMAGIQGMPMALQTWLPQFLNDFMLPELIIGVVFAVLGLGLIVLSILYKPRQGAPPAPPAPPEAREPASPAA